MIYIESDRGKFGEKPLKLVALVEGENVKLELGGIPPVEVLERALEFLGIESPLDLLEKVLEADSLEGIIEKIKEIGKSEGIEDLEYVDEPGRFEMTNAGLRIPLVSAASGNLGSLLLKGNPSPEFVLKLLTVIDAITSISEGYILMKRGREMLESALDVLAEALEKRVKGGERARRIREEIFERVGGDLYDDVDILKLSLRVYDVGKIGVRDSILLKLEWEMNPVEFEEYKRHTEYGWEILRSIKEIPPEILDAVLYHHERIDGSGYPKGLKGDEIPRIAIVVGAIDELSTRLSSDEDIEEAFEKMKDKFPRDVLDVLKEAIG